MVQGPRHFKRSPRSTHTKAPVMFDYLVTAASAAAAYPNPPSNARCAASNCTELPGRMADFERKSAIRVHVTGVVRTAIYTPGFGFIHAIGTHKQALQKWIRCVSRNADHHRNR